MFDFGYFPPYTPPEAAHRAASLDALVPVAGGRVWNAVYFSTSTTYRRIVFCALSRCGAKSVHAFDL
jgi:hypothetical protein